MANKYFVWKNGNPQEWEELTGTEFYKLTASAAAQGRFFTKMTGEDESEDSMTFESTQAVFKQNKKDRNRVTHLAKRNADYIISNFSSLDLDTNDEDIQVDDMITDTSTALEDFAFEQMLVEDILETCHELDAVDQLILQKSILGEIYTSERRKQQQIADDIGISKQAVFIRKEKILKKLKNRLDFLRKNQQ